MKLQNLTPIKLSLKESILMIFIEAAHQDNVFSIEEKAHLLKQFDPNTFNKVLNIYNSLSAGRRIELVVELLYNLEICGNSFKKLKYDLLVLFHADGHFCSYEKEFLIFLEEVSVAVENKLQLSVS